MTPDASERADDERILDWLAHWDAGWTAAEIAAKDGVSRNTVLGMVVRVGKADPGCLRRSVYSERRAA